MRIGISGGTFDPIHKGHIESALAAAEQLNLDKVIFVPGGEPPHKLDRRITAAEDRLAMLDAAVASYDKLEVSLFEINKKEYSFSIDTVRYFKEKYGSGTELFYIIGADVAGELEHWKAYSELFNLCNFAALLRPGHRPEDFQKNIQRSTNLGARIFTVNSPMIDISSNEIRDAVKSGNIQTIADKVPAPVIEYIITHKLYTREFPFDEEYARENMEKRLKPQRYQHCLRVSEEAVRIGKMVGADPEKCRIAGLFHDCGKDVSVHQLYWLDPGLIEMGKAENGGNPAIVHGPAGAVIATKKYGIIDSEILEAIRCHVTGAPDMGVVAQAVFVADYTEPGRRGESFDRIRQALEGRGDAGKKLVNAVVTACDESIAYVLTKGEILSPATVETRNSFLIRKEENK